MAMVIGPTPPGTGVIAAGDRGGFGIGDVADQPRLALAALRRRNAVHADVDHHGAGLDPDAAHQFRPADGGDDDIGARARSPAGRACANGRW